VSESKKRNPFGFWGAGCALSAVFTSRCERYGKVSAARKLKSPKPLSSIKATCLVSKVEETLTIAKSPPCVDTSMRLEVDSS
jgi:hypothetical protein